MCPSSLPALELDLLLLSGSNLPDSSSVCPTSAASVSVPVIVTAAAGATQSKLEPGKLRCSISSSRSLSLSPSSSSSSSPSAPPDRDHSTFPPGLPRGLVDPTSPACQAATTSSPLTSSDIGVTSVAFGPSFRSHRHLLPKLSRKYPATVELRPLPRPGGQFSLPKSPPAFGSDPPPTPTCPPASEQARALDNHHHPRACSSSSHSFKVSAPDRSPPLGSERSALSRPARSPARLYNSSLHIRLPYSTHRRALSLPELSQQASSAYYLPQIGHHLPTLLSRMTHTFLLARSPSESSRTGYGSSLGSQLDRAQTALASSHSAPIRANSRSQSALHAIYSGRLRRRSHDDDQSSRGSGSLPPLRKARSSSTLLSTTGLQPNIELGVGERMTLPLERQEDVGITRSPLSDPESPPIGPELDLNSEDSLLLTDCTSDCADEPVEDDSPFALVRASVAPTDNISLSINTPRMWFFSLLFAFLGSSTNLFFSLRYPSVSITPMIALLLVHPLGLLWDRILKRDDDPVTHFVNGSPCKLQDAPLGPSSTWKRRFRLWLAQGQWNGKEHCCVFISSNVSFGFAFATDLIVEQTMFYKQDFGIVYKTLLIVSTQILGYSLAGLTRGLLVHPTGMMWPQALNTASMFSTLHKSESLPANGWKISKYRFFLYVFLASLGVYFLPGLLFPALSYFNFLTWFAPDNVVVANLFGVVSGLGLFPVTFDWAQVAYIGSPLIVPLWAAANVVVGIGIVVWLLAPILYYSNYLYSSFMPILSASVFDNTGHVYDVSKILTQDLRFDEKGYEDYSRVFLPITYVLSYFGQFAGLAALVTNTFCWHGREIWEQLKFNLWPGDARRGYHSVGGSDPTNSQLPSRRHASIDSTPPTHGLLSGQDVHNRLMQRYDDVPLLWYILTGVSMTAIGIFVVEYYPIFLPWYGLLFALLVCTVLFLPIAIVQAVANQHISIYLICQLLSGVFFPGKPVANMVFTTYGYISMTQGVKFSSDLKLGHYMKVPPKILFTVQLVATLASSLTQLSVLNWMLTNVPGICTTEAINGFTCPIARVHFNGSILWGVVGPARFFGADGLYRNLLWAFPFGAILPIVTFVAFKRTKRSFFRKVSFPVMFSALSWIPPATGINFSVWAVVCWLFNDVIKHNAFAWWSKYNMTLSAALDSGLAAGVCIVFFGFIYPGWMDGFSWWGTEVYKQGCDWQSCSFKTVPPGGTFGPP